MWLNRPVNQPKWATNGRQIIRGIAVLSVVDCLGPGNATVIVNSEVGMSNSRKFITGPPSVTNHSHTLEHLPFE